jgi:hypothetical protein
VLAASVASIGCHPAHRLADCGLEHYHPSGFVPVDYGFFATHWRYWPKDHIVGEQPAEEVPTPAEGATPEGAPPEGTQPDELPQPGQTPLEIPGLDDVFGPEGPTQPPGAQPGEAPSQPLPQDLFEQAPPMVPGTPGAMPPTEGAPAPSVPPSTRPTPMPPMPDATAPPLPDSTMPPMQPEGTQELTPLPDSLFPETPSSTPPGADTKQEPTLAPPLDTKNPQSGRPWRRRAGQPESVLRTGATAPTGAHSLRSTTSQRGSSDELMLIPPGESDLQQPNQLRAAPLPQTGDIDEEAPAEAEPTEWRAKGSSPKHGTWKGGGDSARAASPNLNPVNFIPERDDPGFATKVPAGAEFTHRGANVLRQSGRLMDRTGSANPLR